MNGYLSTGMKAGVQPNGHIAKGHVNRIKVLERQLLGCADFQSSANASHWRDGE